MNQFTLGNIEIIRVIEWHGAFAPVNVLFPSVPEELWREHESWLSPDFQDAGDYHAYMQTWVLHSAGRTVVDRGRRDRDRANASSTCGSVDGDAKLVST